MTSFVARVAAVLLAVVALACGAVVPAQAQPTDWELDLRVPVCALKLWPDGSRSAGVKWELTGRYLAPGTGVKVVGAVLLDDETAGQSFDVMDLAVEVDGRVAHEGWERVWLEQGQAAPGLVTVELGVAGVAAPSAPFGARIVTAAACSEAAPEKAER